MTFICQKIDYLFLTLKGVLYGHVRGNGGKILRYGELFLHPQGGVDMQAAVRDNSLLFHTSGNELMLNALVSNRSERHISSTM